MWKELGRVNNRYHFVRGRLLERGFSVSGHVMGGVLYATEPSSVPYSYVTPILIGKDYPHSIETGDLVNQRHPLPVANLLLDGTVKKVNAENPKLREFHKKIEDLCA